MSVVGVKILHGGIDRTVLVGEGSEEADMVALLRAAFQVASGTEIVGLFSEDDHVAHPLSALLAEPSKFDDGATYRLIASSSQQQPRQQQQSNQGRLRAPPQMESKVGLGAAAPQDEDEEAEEEEAEGDDEEYNESELLAENEFLKKLVVRSTETLQEMDTEFTNNRVTLLSLQQSHRILEEFVVRQADIITQLQQHHETNLATSVSIIDKFQGQMNAARDQNKRLATHVTAVTSALTQADQAKTDLEKLVALQNQLIDEFKKDRVEILGREQEAGNLAARALTALKAAEAKRAGNQPLITSNPDKELLRQLREQREQNQHAAHHYVTKLDELNTENTNQAEVIKHYREQNGALQEMLELKQTQLEQFQARLVALSSAVDQLGSSFAGVKDSAGMQKANTQLRLQLQLREEQVEKLEAVLSEISKTVNPEERRKELEEIMAKVEKIQEQQQQDKEQYESKLVAERQQHTAAVRDLQELLERQVGQLNELTQERDSLESQLKDKGITTTAKGGAASSAPAPATSVEAELKALRDENAALKAAQAEHKSAVSELERKKGLLYSSRAIVKQKAAALLAEKEQLLKQVTDLGQKPVVAPGSPLIAGGRRIEDPKPDGSPANGNAAPGAGQPAPKSDRYIRLSRRDVVE